MKIFGNADFICIYGWSEDLYKQAHQWVNDSRRVVFVTKEEKKSDHPLIKIYEICSPLQQLPIARKIGWSAVFLQLKLVMLEENLEFQTQVEQSQLAANLLLSQAADFGVKLLKNAKANQISRRSGLLLKDAFTNIPAIIVGAGPSLKKNGHLLKEFKDKALIFAGGSALNAMTVEPHFTAAVDPIAPKSQFKAHRYKNSAFLYQSRINPENLRLVEGEKILFPDSFSHVINWVEGQPRFSSGWTVGNFLTAVAGYLGCSPIILVGMDLCYQRGRKYAEQNAGPEATLIEARGKWTQQDFLMSAYWTEEFAKTHDVINATEEGILQLKKETFSDLLQKLSSIENLQKSVREAIEKIPLENSCKKWSEWEIALKEKDPVAQELLLDPLWQIWKPIFEREIEIDPTQNLELHQELFFEKVFHEHTR